MDFLTQQFIAAKASLTRELRNIGKRLTSIQKTIQREIKTKHKAEHAKEKQQNTPSVLWAEFKVPHSEKYRNETQAARELIRDNWKLYVEIFTLLVVLAYATVTAFQLRETRTANQIAQTALEAQTRPWLGVEGLVVPRIPMGIFFNNFAHGRVDVPFSFTLSPRNTILQGEGFAYYDGIFNLRNYGSTPALHGAYSVAMVIDWHDSKRASDGSCIAANKAATAGHDSNESRQGLILFPTAEQPQEFVAGVHAAKIPKSAFLLGCIVYDDTRGKRHTTRFCESVFSDRHRPPTTCSLQTFAD
jgi:hypothetical protein